MFDEDAFTSWPLVLAGAAVFTSAFGLLALLGQYVAGGHVRLSGTVVGLGVAAFVGYVGVALLVRAEHRTPEDP